jgi:hypothetical protein
MIFQENQGRGIIGRVVQIRPDSNFTGGRGWGILRPPKELAHRTGVWNMLRMCSYIIVDGFPSTLSSSRPWV